MAVWTAAILLALGLAWFVAGVVVPYFQVRAAAGRVLASESSPEVEADKLGRPEKAVAKCGFYLRLPARLAPDRWGAVRILGSCGSPAVPVLITALKDSDTYVRFLATRALGNLKDPRAIESLIVALKDLDGDVRLGAASALGNMRSPQTVAPLNAALKNPDSRVRVLAALALGRLHDPRAVEPLITTLKDPNADVRFCAAGALGELKDPRAVEPLKALLQEKGLDARVRSAAAEALKKIRGEEAGK